ncbi:MAG: hypothetical protein JF595_12665 [Sphingomonadales bacterium]|nr:hypothetical protein [Sphingomonadales bacterium]
MRQEKRGTPFTKHQAGTAADRRRRPRLGVLCRQGSHYVRVDIKDISPYGVRASFIKGFRPGARRVFRIPFLEPLEAIVVWVNEHEAGCEFTTPLHPAAFAVVSRALGMNGSGRKSPGSLH